MYFKRIRELREDHDLSQEVVAKILSTTQENYQRYESGKRTIPIEKAIKLAEYYKVSLDYLTGRID